MAFLFVLFLPQKPPLCLAHSRKNRTRLRIREFQTHSQTTDSQRIPFSVQSPKLLFLCREARTTSPKGLFRHPAEALSRSDRARLSRRVWPFRPSARPKSRFRYASGPLPHPFSALFDRLAPTVFCMLFCAPDYHLPAAASSPSAPCQTSGTVALPMLPVSWGVTKSCLLPSLYIYHTIY